MLVDVGLPPVAAVPWHDPQLLPGASFVWHPLQSGGVPIATGYTPTVLPFPWQPPVTHPEKGTAPAADKWAEPGYGKECGMPPPVTSIVPFTCFVGSSKPLFAALTCVWQVLQTVPDVKPVWAALAGGKP